MKLILRICLLVLVGGWLLLLHSAERTETPAGIKSSDDIAVVVNARNDVSELTLAELRKILLGEKRFWPNTSDVDPAPTGYP